MSEAKDGSAVPEQVDSVAGQESETLQESVSDTKSDVVKYETYRRAVGDAKKYKSKVEELSEKLTLFEQSQLQSEGKKDELIEQLRKHNSELSTKYKGAVGSFARGKALDAIVDEAVKSGCSSTSLLKKVALEQLDALNFDDEFNPDREQVKLMVEEIRKAEPILFSKDAPKIASHNLNTTTATPKQTSAVSQMKEDDLMKAWEQANMKG